MRTSVGIINRNQNVNKATDAQRSIWLSATVRMVALFTCLFRLIIPTLVRIQKFWSLFISINVTKIYEYAKFWADRLHWGWMAASATPTSKTTNPPVPVVWWYRQGCTYVGVNIGVMRNCIPSMSKAVFGLICDFIVIVIVDFLKFYCNTFVIAKAWFIFADQFA